MTPDGHERACPKCGVHRRICVCDQCLPVTGAPKLWVLQHPDEQGQSKGTLRIAQACLPNLEVLVGESGEDFAPLWAQIDPDNTGVLFPGPSSLALEGSQVALPKTWILIDGTWRKAKRIFLANPGLASLPGFHFQAPPKSRYRIRKAGGTGHLSTVEAIHQLLAVTHPRCDTQPLMGGLEALVDVQLAQMPDQVRRRYG